jgi:predicted transcriptional regulator
MAIYISQIFAREKRLLKRRSRGEVIVDILHEALHGANKTRIMYRANMNFIRFERYFGELLSKGLIVVVDNPGVYSGGIIYQTTEKGRVLLDIWKQAEKIVSL